MLTHVTTTLELLEQGAPVDLVFQSVAGTQAANRGFGVTLDLLREAHAAASELRRGTVGNNVTYFETGQGSALSADAHRDDGGRGPADPRGPRLRRGRAFDPLLVNTVVGFIGPEYLYDGKQILRAGLEDHLCGKLLGVPMGVDVCYTNHAEADADDTDTLLLTAGRRGLLVRHHRPGGRRHHAQLPVAVVPGRAAGRARCSGCGRRRSSRRGWGRWGCSTTAGSRAAAGAASRSGR